VDGDGRADVCALRQGAVHCALAKGDGYAAPQKWSSGADFGDVRIVRLGDINGDGRADVCARTREGLVCALSNGRGFLKGTVWLTEMGDAAGWPKDADAFELVDLRGSGRADVCAVGPTGPVCAYAP
jgi:hypothetical protein